MSTAVMTNRLELSSVADIALKAAMRFWFVVAITGQLIFAFTVASFYGMAGVRGDWRAWNKGMAHGYISGDTMGNFAVAVHLFSAVIVILAGVIQLIPQIRERAPSLHRWNGRLYVVTAFTISIAGLFMMWGRGTVGDLWQHLGQSLNAVLIMLCAAMALRYALARDFKTHRRWALRLYLVVSASLFIRVGLFLSLFLNHGPFGFDPTTFSGPFLTFLSFAQYLFPLAVLEIYFRVQARAAAPGQFATAACLFMLTVAMGAGIFVVTMGVWLPRVKAAYDNRKSIVETLSATIASSGIDAAARQYHDLKAAEPAIYNFDEEELNNLGYEFIRGKKLKEAIRILQLNVEAYPQSSNAYDSLGEAYMNAGNKPEAITNYQKSVQLNPKNRNAIVYLQKLNAH
jgi:tetratricopeptide (TPR) repeat protein